jgi:hypothetical protein
MAAAPAECKSNDSPWLICKPCAAAGKCALDDGDFEPVAEVHLSPLSGQSWIKSRNGKPIADMPAGPLYDEHAMNLMRVRQFALESASGHLGALIDDQRRLLAWAYGKLAHVEWTKQDDALAMDELKLMLTEAA